ncbi:MAG: hypothetical protein HQL23_08405 [Candidatus Omnitrophica bacterium]|nr:hypothetical protein [Candidatus Omnitrophota bacterium]
MKTIFARERMRAQVSTEFMFCMMVIFFMIYALYAAARWAGLDLAQRRLRHDQILNNEALDVKEQLQPDFSQPLGLNSVWR